MELARADGASGEVVLRRRGTVEELIVNGTFAMDSTDTSSERLLATIVLTSAARVRRVLVGGLGLGYTAAEFLQHKVEHVDVVELEDALVSWARAGLTPTLARVATDPRVRLHVADITAVLQARRGSAVGPWDAIVLDVDNGPDFLIHQTNARLYQRALLGAALRRLTPTGSLTIWCQAPSAQLNALCQELSPNATEHCIRVTRDGRQLEYAIYTLGSPGSSGTQRSARMSA
jgi:spermidine synthase